MSFSVSAYLVDWDELSKRWKQFKKTPQKGKHWFYQAIEDQEPWVQQHLPKHWVHSWNAAVDAGFFYDDARLDLKPALRKKIDKYLRPFLGTSAKHHHRVHVQDLAGRDTDDGLFEITMSPATVKEFFARADFEWLEKLRPLWDEHNCMIEPDFTHMKNFGCFKRYMNQWKKVLQTAVRKKMGLVINIV